MYGTGQTWVEGTDNAPISKGFFSSFILVPIRACSTGPGVLVISGRQVPGAGDDALVVGDFLVLDLNPVAQRTPGAINQAHAGGFVGYV